MINFRKFGIVAIFALSLVGMVSALNEPVVNSSTILPSPAYANTTLIGWCNATTGDAANVTYNYTWFKNGVNSSSGQTPSDFVISIDINTTVASNLTNFPAKVSLNTSNSTLWNTTTCTNVIFKDASNNTLNYELDSSSPIFCGNTTNNATFWVLGNYTGNALTRIYANLGNIQIINKENRTNVWFEYTAVLHGNNLSESTDKFNFSSAGGEISYTTDSLRCKTGSCFSFPNASVYLNAACSNALPQGNNKSTSTAWAYRYNNTGATYVFGFGHTGTIGQGRSLGEYGVDVEAPTLNNSVVFETYGSNPRNVLQDASPKNIPYFYAGIYNGTHIIASNGTAFSSLASAHQIGACSFFRVGVAYNDFANGWGKYSTNNTIDEVRLTNVSRSNDWITAEYSQFSITGAVEKSIGVSQGVDTNIDSISSSSLAVGQNWTLQCLAYNANGASSALNSSVLTISSRAGFEGCGNLSTAGATYSLLNDVSSPGATCFTSNESNITLNCNGFTITGTGTGNGFTSTAANQTVKNCIFNTFTTGISLTGINGVILNNTVINLSNYGMSITGAGSSITNNSVYNSTWGAMTIGSTIDVINNLINNATTSFTGISANGKSNVLIDCMGKQWTGNSGTSKAFYHKNGNNVTIKNCNISNFNIGISVTESSNSNFYLNNTISTVSDAFLSTNGPGSNTIANSTFTSVSGNGVDFSTNSGNSNVVSDCNITAGGTYGLRLSAISTQSLRNRVIVGSSSTAVITANQNVIINRTYASGGIGFDLSGPNIMLDLSNATSNGTYGIKLSGTDHMHITNSIGNATTNGAGIYSAITDATTQTDILRSIGQSNTGIGISLSGVKKMVVANSTSISTSATSVSIATTSGVSFINNSISATSGAALTIAATSGANTFMLNNFTTTTGVYVSDLNGTNNYNGTYATLNQGNIYGNVINGSISVKGTVNSSLTGLYIGSVGAGVPYSNSTSGGKFSCNFAGCADYAPLTNDSRTNTAPTITAITTGPAGATQLSTLACTVTATDPEQATTNVTISWFKNGANVTALATTYTGLANNTATVVSNVTSGNLTGAENWSCSAAVFDGVAYSSFNSSTNLTLGTAPVATWVSQTPADVSSTNVVDTALNIQYTIIGDGIINATALLWSKVNSTTNPCTAIINGTCEDIFESDVVTSSSGSTMNFSLYDNEIYPHVENYGDTLFRTIVHNKTTLSNANSYYATEYINVSNTTQYTFYEQMFNSTTATGVRVYACNQSYAFSNAPGGNSNCVQIASKIANAGYDHCHGTANQSCHQVMTMAINTTTGTIGGSAVKVTPKMYFILRGNVGATINIWQIGVTVRVGATKLSTNSGNAWTNQTVIDDGHLHQYTGNDTLYYYACANNTANCSSVKTDLIELGGMAPEPSSVYSPTTSNYSKRSLIPINYTAAMSPNGYPIVYYNITYADENGTLIAVIQGNNSVNLNYGWNASAIVAGNYIVKVEAYDNNSLSARGTSEIFTLREDLIENATVSNFVNATTSHSFLVNGSVDNADGATLVMSNVSSTLGTCVQVSNDTSGARFNIQYNCISTTPGSTTITIGFNNSFGTYTSANAANSYPDHAASLGAPTITPATAYITTALTCNAGVFSDIDSDTENVGARTWKWFKNSVEMGGETTDTLAIGNFVKGDSIICEETAVATIWTTSTATTNSTAKVITNTAPTSGTVDTFVDGATTHSFTVNGSVTDADGGTDIITTNVSSTLGTCTYVSNTTDGTTFRVLYNCVSTTPGSAVVTIGFTDASAAYTDSVSASHAYPDHMPAITTTSVSTPLYINSTATCTEGMWSDPDSDTENVAVRQWFWYKNGALEAGCSASTCLLSAITAVKGDNIACGENATATTWTVSTAYNISTNVSVSNSLPYNASVGSFVDTAVGHFFTVNGSVTDQDGGTDIVATNISSTLGTCTYVSNSTSGVTFNVMYNCTSTTPGNTTIVIGFTDASAEYTDATGATHAYPDHMPVLTVPTIALPLYANSTATCTNGSFSDIDGDTENTTTRTWKWYHNGVEEVNQTNSTFVLSAGGVLKNHNVSCYERVIANTWTVSIAENYSINATVENSVPSIPNQTGPINETILYTPTANMTWNASSDIDNDTLNYTICYGVTNATSTCLNTSETWQNLTMTSNLTYYWKVRSCDGTNCSAYSPIHTFNSTYAPILSSIATYPQPFIYGDFIGCTYTITSEMPTANVTLWLEKGDGELPVSGIHNYSDIATNTTYTYGSMLPSTDFTPGQYWRCGINASSVFNTTSYSNYYGLDITVIVTPPGGGGSSGGAPPVTNVTANASTNVTAPPVDTTQYTSSLFGVKFKVSDITKMVYSGIQVGHVIIMLLLLSTLLIGRILKAIGIDEQLAGTISILYIAVAIVLVIIVGTVVTWKFV